MTQRMQAKEESIKQLRSQLEHLTNELNKTTEYIQLLEIQDESKSKRDSSTLIFFQILSVVLQTMVYALK